MTVEIPPEIDPVPKRRDPVSVTPRRGPTMILKRTVDVIGATALLVLTSPILLLAAAAIRLTSRGPIMFRQPRIGLGGAPFVMIKFRTMYDGVSDAAHRRQNLAELAGGGRLEGAVAYKDESDPRVTRAGRVLRRFSIDELPQLINVVRGDMSLVGPRPSLVWEVDAFPPHVDRRFAVRPGITGVWQVSGRNQWSMLEMLELDCTYVDQLTVRGDILILLKTIPAAIRGDGAA